MGYIPPGRRLPSGGCDVPESVDCQQLLASRRPVPLNTLRCLLRVLRYPCRCPRSECPSRVEAASVATALAMCGSQSAPSRFRKGSFRLAHCTGRHGELERFVDRRSKRLRLTARHAGAAAPSRSDGILRRVAEVRSEVLDSRLITCNEMAISSIAIFTSSFMAAALLRGRLWHDLRQQRRWVPSTACAQGRSRVHRRTGGPVPRGRRARGRRHRSSSRHGDRGGGGQRRAAQADTDGSRRASEHVLRAGNFEERPQPCGRCA